MADSNISAKGKTRWFPRSTPPVRHGFYECAVKICSSAPLFLFTLEWDGVGFLVPGPFVVRQWRGMTKGAHQATSPSTGEPT